MQKKNNTKILLLITTNPDIWILTVILRTKSEESQILRYAQNDMAFCALLLIFPQQSLSQRISVYSAIHDTF
jgi:hypothetical protein